MAASARLGPPKPKAARADPCVDGPKTLIPRTSKVHRPGGIKSTAKNEIPPPDLGSRVKPDRAKNLESASPIPEDPHARQVSARRV